MTTDTKVPLEQVASRNTSKANALHTQHHRQYLRGRQQIVHKMSSSLVFNGKGKAPARALHNGTSAEVERDVTDHQEPNPVYNAGHRNVGASVSSDKKLEEVGTKEQSSSSVYSSDRSDGAYETKVKGEQDVNQRPATTNEEDGNEALGEHAQSRGPLTAPDGYIQRGDSSENHGIMTATHPQPLPSTWWTGPGVELADGLGLPDTPSYAIRQRRVEEWLDNIFMIAVAPYDDVSDMSDTDDEVGTDTAGGGTFVPSDRSSDVPCYFALLESGGYSNIMERQPDGGLFERDPLFRDLYKGVMDGPAVTSASSTEASAHPTWKINDVTRLPKM